MREEEVGLLLRKRYEVELLLLDRQRTALEQPHVEEVARERREPSALVVDDLEVAALLLGWELALEQQGREPDDRGQRGSNLVGDHADQVALVLLALTKTFVLLQQLAPPHLERAGHRVERIRKTTDPTGAALLDPNVEIPACDLGGRRGDPAHRRGDRAGDPGAEQQ